jgi:hypothetical protein
MRPYSVYWRIQTVAFMDWRWDVNDKAIRRLFAGTKNDGIKEWEAKLEGNS